MTSSVSMSNLVFSGTAAQAQGAIYQIMALYSSMSSQFDKLMILDTVSSYKSADATSNNTEKAANEQASQMRDQAMGEFISGGVMLGGMGVAMGYSSFAGKGLASEEAELESMKEYQSATKEALSKNPGIRLDNFAEGEDEETKQMKRNVDELSQASNYSSRDLKADKNTLEWADENDLKKISKHLETQMSSLEDQLNQRKSRIDKNSDHLIQGSNAFGQIGRAMMNTGAASHQQDAGKFEAMKVMSQEGGKIMDQLYQQSSQNASKYAEMSVQLPEILTGLQQADSSQT